MGAKRKARIEGGTFLLRCKLSVLHCMGKATCAPDQSRSTVCVELAFALWNLLLITLAVFVISCDVPHFVCRRKKEKKESSTLVGIISGASVPRSSPISFCTLCYQTSFVFPAQSFLVLLQQVGLYFLWGCRQHNKNNMLARPHREQ